jgi:hypothetical protein
MSLLGSKRSQFWSSLQRDALREGGSGLKRAVGKRLLIIGLPRGVINGLCESDGSDPWSGSPTAQPLTLPARR